MTLSCFGYALFSDTAYYAAKELNLEWLGYFAGKTLHNISKVRRLLKPVKRLDNIKADVLITSRLGDETEDVVEVAQAIKASYILWDLGEMGRSLDAKVLAFPSLVMLQALDWNVVILEGVSAHRYGANLIENRSFLLASKHEFDPLPQNHDVTYPTRPLETIVNIKQDDVVEPITDPRTGAMFHRKKVPLWALNKTANDFHIFTQNKLNPLFWPNFWVIGNKVHRITPKELATMLRTPFRLRKTLLTPFWGSRVSVFIMLKEPCYLVWKDMMRRWLWKGAVCE